MRITPIYHRVVASLALICAVGLALAAGGAWRKQQTIWWNDAQLVKSAISGYLKLFNSSPELRSKDNPLWDIDSLVLILDARNDEATLKALVSLSSYNLGASGSEVYQCVLWRKGPKIVPLLQTTLASGMNECEESVGRGALVCRTKAENAGWLKDNIEAIKADRSCMIEQ